MDGLQYSVSACTVMRTIAVMKLRYVRRSCEDQLDEVVIRATPDDHLFEGVIQRHEELRFFSNATDKIAHEHVEAVCGRGLDPCRDSRVIHLDIRL